MNGDVDLFTDTTNPFDAGRTPCPQGGEDRWSARWLMEQMGYPTWQHFEPVVERAKSAAHNEGFNIKILFTVDRKNTGGRPQTDYLVSRYAAYLIAMNGDPRKREVSAAQHYFAIKTREAETAPAATPPAVMPTHSEALRGWAEELERAELAEAERDALKPSAAAWTELADAAGDYSVADAAKVLSRDPNISTGRDRLFKSMQGLSWVYRYDGHWRAYQAQVDCGRLTEKVGRPYYHAGRDELVGSEPTIRITPKGLQELHKRLGGGGQQLTLAVAE